MKEPTDGPKEIRELAMFNKRDSVKAIMERPIDYEREFDELKPGNKRPNLYKERDLYTLELSYGDKADIYLNEFESAYKDVEHDIHNNSVRYSIDRSLDNERTYRRGRIITIHERELPTGLLGYTDTNNEIVLTTKNDFDIPKQKVLVHEVLHCSTPDDSEVTVRYKTELEFDPTDLSQLNFSFYSEPLYETEA